jgi:GTPase SAR1 family protein
MPPKFNIVVVGDKGVGKTTFLQQLIYKQFNSEYLTTDKINIYNYKYDNNVYNFYDIPVNPNLYIDQFKDIETVNKFIEKFSTFTLDNNEKISMIIIMSNEIERSQHYQDMWYEMIRYSNEYIPIIRVYNTFLNVSVPANIDCCISVKNNSNISELFNLIEGKFIVE